MNTTSKAIDDLDVDALVAAMEAEDEARLNAPRPPTNALNYVQALEDLATATDTWRKAIQQRDIAMAAHNEGIKLLRVRLERARTLAEELRPKRPVGRPPRAGR